MWRQEKSLFWCTGERIGEEKYISCLLHNKLSQILWLKQHWILTITHSFWRAGMWKGLGQVVLAQGLFWGWSQDCGQGCNHLKTESGLETAPKTVHSHSWQLDAGYWLEASVTCALRGAAWAPSRHGSWLSPDWVINKGAGWKLPPVWWPSFRSHTDVSAVHYQLQRPALVKVGGNTPGRDQQEARISGGDLGGWLPPEARRFIQSV